MKTKKYGKPFQISLKSIAEIWAGLDMKMTKSNQI